MSGAQVHLDAKSIFTENPSYTLFSADYKEKEPYVGESYEIPFDQTNVYYDDSSSVLIPPKGDIIRRITVRSTLPALYEPLGPGYVYPLYTDQVDGSVYVQNDVLALQPGDFIGYFNTQFLNAWATVFVGAANLAVSYDTTTNKFTFTSPTFANIYFHNDSSGVFWGFDPRSFDFLTPAGYKGYNFKNGTLVAPLSLVQSGWIRGFTPPPGVGFSYVDSVACRLIRSATLSIGGQTIDRLTAERLIIEDDLGVLYENQTGLTILEGKGDSSQIYAPREYYTRLTFNIDTLNVNKLYRQDLRVDVDYEKFENLPQTLVTTKSLTDGASYLNTNIKTLLGIDANAIVFHTNFYKKYVVYVVEDTTRPYYQRYYFYDTTKPIGSVSSWVYWNDPEFHQLGVVRPYFIGGTMYTTMYQNPYIRSIPVADMLTGTAVATQGAIIFPGLYEGTVSVEGFTADARYLYLDINSPIMTFGSNTGYLYLTTPNANDGRTTTQTIDLVYNVASISTPQLIDSDNVALITFVTTSCSTIPGVSVPPSSVIITSQTKVGSDITVMTRTTYPYSVTIGGLFTIDPPTFYTTVVPLTGSNVATFISCTPECAYSTTVVTYKVYNISTPQLIPSDNTAVINFINTWAPNYGGNIKTVTITSEIKTLSNIFVTANVAYTYTSNGQPAPHIIRQPVGLSNNRRHITVRYDTTKSISQWSSYDFLSFSGTGAPKTWFDISGGVNPIAFAPLPLAFDGRNIYADIQGRGYLTKIDTQNFLDAASYTYFNVNGLTNSPNLSGIPYSQVPNATDGRYFYFQTKGFTAGSVYLIRYDSTQSISSASAYSSLLFTSSAFPNGYSLYPYGFDGKSIYYVGGTYNAVRASILRYDTTTNTVSDWIIFDGNGKALTSQGTTVNTISWVSKNKFNDVPVVAVLSCLVSARYVYLTETWGGGGETFNDFVQFDPLVMTGTLKSSVIVKYEKYTKPPETPQTLYGQTLLNEFTMIQGRVFDSFNLSVPASVREFWVTVDTPAIISRIVLRLNNEVLVDDDRVTTRYIRAFESHSTMPSSSNVSVYSFSVDPQKMTPSGTLNMSRVASPVLDVYLVAPVSTNVKVRFYAKTFNVLEIQNGLGGLLFNSGF
jgi:hypothetical protein